MSDEVASRRSADGSAPSIGASRRSFPGSLSPVPSAEEARQMLNTVTAGILKISTEGRVLYANTQARKLLTIHEIDPLGMSVREFEPYTVWPDGSPCAYEDCPPIKCLRTGELQVDVVVGLQLPAAPMLWIKVTAEPLLDPTTGKPAAALVTLVESTHPKHVEESLKQSEDRYRRLIEHSPDAIVVHRGGPIVFINEAGVKLWRGRSREDFIGRNILDFVHPRFREQAERRVQKIMEGGHSTLMEQRHVRLDGKPVYIEVAGSWCVYDGQRCVQAIFRDVTRRKRMDRQLRRQREMLRVFFRSIPVLVGVYGKDGRVKALNREWKRLIGWDENLCLDELIEKFYPDPNDRRLAVEYMQASAPGWRDFTVQVADGVARQLSWANIKLSNGDHIGIALDVTDRRQAEEELRQAKVELERHVKERTEELMRKNVELRRKQRFMERSLAAQERDRKLVAYEIHDTILQEVIGALMYVDTIYDNEEAAQGKFGPPLEQTRKLLRKCIDEARQMISGLRPPVIDEQGVVGAIDYLVTEFNSRGMAIRYTHAMQSERLEPELETTIFRIVQEALTNVERHSGARQAEVRLSQLGETIHIDVSDAGHGFDPESVGERHFGLDGMRERARLLDGSVSIRSSSGNGTEVIVELPVRIPKDLPQ